MHCGCTAATGRLSREVDGSTDAAPPPTAGGVAAAAAFNEAGASSGAQDAAAATPLASGGPSRFRRPMFSQRAGQYLRMNVAPLALGRGARAGVVTTLGGYHDLDAPQSHIAHGAAERDLEMARRFADQL